MRFVLLSVLCLGVITTEAQTRQHILDFCIFDFYIIYFYIFDFYIFEFYIFDF